MSTQRMQALCLPHWYRTLCSSWLIQLTRSYSGYVTQLGTSPSAALSLERRERASAQGAEAHGLTLAFPSRPGTSAAQAAVTPQPFHSHLGHRAASIALPVAIRCGAGSTRQHTRRGPAGVASCPTLHPKPTNTPPRRLSDALELLERWRRALRQRWDGPAPGLLPLPPARRAARERHRHGHSRPKGRQEEQLHKRPHHGQRRPQQRQQRHRSPRAGRLAQRCSTVR